MTKNKNPPDADSLRSEYDLSQLQGGDRGKYANRDQITAERGSNSNLLRVAIACGAIPLVIGSFIYWTWRATRAEWLPAAGLFTVFGGLVCFAVGAICLGAYAWRERVMTPNRRIPLGWQCTLATILLLVNFPAAAFYAVSAVNLMLEYRVVIENKSGQPIDSFVVRGPGVNLKVGPIPAGGLVEHALQFSGDGKLEFAARQNETCFNGEIEGYVTRGQDGLTTIRVLRGDKFELERMLD